VLDAPYEEVLRQYDRSAIYVHASGFGRDLESEPELFEHFGMAVAQVIGSGCVPIVYGAAGPKEVINLVGDGVTFASLDELTNALRLMIESENSGKLDETRARLVSQARQFSRTTQTERLIEIFRADLLGAVNHDERV
jgi:hypothetical protein